MISDSALAKVKIAQEIIKIKEMFRVKDFFIYDVSNRRSYGISPSPNWNKCASMAYVSVKNPVSLEGMLDRMANEQYTVWYIDEEIEFKNLDDFLEHYYTVKLSGI